MSDEQLAGEEAERSLHELEAREPGPPELEAREPGPPEQEGREPGPAEPGSQAPGDGGTAGGATPAGTLGAPAAPADQPLRIARRRMSGETIEEIDLDPAWFGLEPHRAVMHQVVTAQLAAARAGTQSTRTRAEVSGGGAKPFRQKGTGRARQGSTRAPHWSGGGVAHAPKPRSYRQRTPKKMTALALRSALSDRAAGSRVALVDRWELAVPKTRDVVAALGALGIAGRVLVVVGRHESAAAKSFANLPLAHVAHPGELSAYDVLRSDWVLFDDATLPGAQRTGEVGA